MSEIGVAARDLAARLARSTGLEVEVLEKRGRSRRLERDAEGESASIADERGWALRVGDALRSGFASGTGEPPSAPRIETGPQPLRLPDAASAPVAAAAAPRAESAFASESELRALLDTIERELARELSGARRLVAAVEEGASESALASSRGLSSRAASRLAHLRLEVAHGARRVTLESWGRAVAELRPSALAGRLVDRLSALDGAAEPRAGRLLLGAPLVARLVEALVPWLVGGEGRARAAALGDRRWAAPGVRLVDDGALAGGLLAAPADGEGVACRAVSLVDEERFVQPLVAWWEAEGSEVATGCSRRASYRDPPRRAPTHLYLDPAADVSVAELLPEAASYLLEAEGGVRVDPAGGGFAVAVSGWRLEGGRATGGLGRRVLTGELLGVLGGVRARARDLTFVAGDGMFGAPSCLVDGLVLSPRSRSISR